MTRGSVLVCWIARVPVYFHWSLPLGLLCLGGSVRSAGAWFGFLLVVLFHEFGHVFLVRRFGYRADHVVIHGFGGECSYSGHPSQWEASVIAWGGILGQALLWNLVHWPLRFGLLPSDFRSSGFFAAVVGYNVLAGIINLIPMGRLDGKQAWQLPRLLFLRLKAYFFAQRILSRGKRRKKEEEDKKIRYLH